jgi:small-conductance mechanosensitive channel
VELPELSTNELRLVTAALAIAVTLVASAVIDRVLRRRERLLIETFPTNYAAIKTRYRLVKRLVVAGVVVLALLSVLETYPVTRSLARTVLASSAVLALVVGLAIRTPLANLGAGLQLAFTQPFRIGDRITVSGETGVVEEIKLSYTVLRTDDQRRVFLPNESLIGQLISNATIGVEVRTLSVTLPVAPDVDLARARELLAEEAAAAHGRDEARAPTVRVADVTASAVMIQVTVWAAAEANVDDLASTLRERAVARLQAEGLFAAVTAGG